MFGMQSRSLQRSFPYIRSLVVGLARDAVILDARESPDAAGEIGPYVVKSEVETDVPEKIPVVGIAGISAHCAPYLPR